MATKFYLVRHGESQGNQKGLFLGHTDMELTEKGHEQAEKTADYLADVPVDAIYSSDLLRAYQTAEHTANRKGLTITKSEQLREIYAGEWEAQSFCGLEKRYPETYGLWLSNIGRARCDKGESVAELQQRLLGEIARIASLHPDQTVFIFTHATPVRTLACAAQNIDLDGIAGVPWPTNASVTVLEYDTGRLTLLSYSEDSFMHELRTVLPDNV